MKLLLVLSISFALAACGSSAKKDTASPKTDAAKTQAGSTAKASEPAKAASSETKSIAGYVCVIGDIKRELRNVKTSTGCSVEYTKDGTTQEIASGSANSTHCSEVMERVKNNLSTAGYKCD